MYSCTAARVQPRRPSDALSVSVRLSPTRARERARYARTSADAFVRQACPGPTERAGGHWKFVKGGFGRARRLDCPLRGPPRRENSAEFVEIHQA